MSKVILFCTFAGLLSAQDYTDDESNVWKITDLSFTCYPNSSILVENLPTDVMLIMAKNLDDLSSCYVTLEAPWLITGCNLTSTIEVTFGQHPDLTGNQIQGGKQGNVISITVQCSHLEEDYHEISNDLGVGLSQLFQFTVSPTYVVTSAFRLSNTDVTTISSANVGDVLSWTIDVAAEYTMRPIWCAAYEGTSANLLENFQELHNEGCTLKENLVESFEVLTDSPDPLSKRYFATVYVFKFYKSDSVLFQCQIKICKPGSKECNIECSGGRRRRQSKNSLNSSFTTTASTVLKIVDPLSTSVTIVPGLVTLTAMLATCLLQV